MIKYAGVLLPIIVVAFMSIAIIFSGRDPSLHGVVFEKVGDSASSIQILLLQIGTLLAVCLAMLRVVSSKFLTKNIVSYKLIILLSFSFLWVGQKVTAGISVNFDFRYQYFYTLIIISAIVFSKFENPDFQFGLLKTVILIANIAGLVLLILLPDLVRQNDYANSIIFDFRYWGLATHANNLGPQLVLLLITAIFFSYKRKLFQALTYLVVFSGLLLSQSKTTIFALIGAAFLYKLIFLGAKFSKKDINKKIKIALIFFVIIFLNIYILFSGQLNLVDGYLTGRGEIWQISMIEFLYNPWFGRGVEIWSEDFSDKFGYLGVASNAHNQIIDALSYSGIFGGFALFVFLGSLICVVNLNNKAGKAFVVLFIFLLLRGFSEVPFRLGVPMSNDFVLLMALVSFLIASRQVEKSNKFMENK